MSIRDFPFDCMTGFEFARPPAGRAGSPATTVARKQVNDMRHCLKTIWRQDDGVLSFEWVLLTTLVVLGIVGGLAAARDAIIDELGDAAQAMLALDNSYSIDWPLEIAVDTDTTDGDAAVVVGLASDSGFTDAFAYTDCERAAAPIGQGPVSDIDS
jgi:hypothetical protein